MWPFTKRAVDERSISVLADGIRALTKKVAVLEDSVDTLAGQHARLRGYVYARKGRAEDVLTPGRDSGALPDRRDELERASARRKLTKDELRELAGLIPLKQAQEALHHEGDKP